MDISTQSVLAIQLWEGLVDMETTNAKVYFPYSAREYLSVTGPSVEPCRAGWAFVLKAQLPSMEFIFSILTKQLQELEISLKFNYSATVILCSRSLT